MMGKMAPNPIGRIFSTKNLALDQRERRKGVGLSFIREEVKL